MDIDLVALRQLERDKEIKLDVLLRALEDALLNAYAKTPGAIDGSRVTIDTKSGRVQVLAPEKDEEGNQVGEFDDTPADFGRVAAATARQVIFQRLREAEDEQKYGHFIGIEGDILVGVVQQDRDSRTVRVDLGSIEAIMPQAEQSPGEEYSHGKRLRVYVVSVRRDVRGPQVVVSRTHPGLVAKLFNMEVPEIEQGVVEIKAIAREAGHRTKIAVISHRPDVSAKGACIGPMGQRVRAIMHELNEEKIDIVDYSDEPADFVAHALSPAKVSSVRTRSSSCRARARTSPPRCPTPRDPRE